MCFIADLSLFSYADLCFGSKIEFAYMVAQKVIQEHAFKLVILRLEFGE